MNRECRNCAHLAAVSVEQALEPDKNDPTILRASCIRCDKHKRFVRPSAFCAFFRPYTEKVEKPDARYNYPTAVDLAMENMERIKALEDRLKRCLDRAEDDCTAEFAAIKYRLLKLEGKCRNG